MLKLPFIKSRITLNYLSVLLVILLVPLIISTLLLQYTSRFAVSQSEQRRYMQLQQMSEMVDENLSFLQRTAIRVAQNKNLLALNYYDSKEVNNIYTTAVLADELDKEVDVNEFCLGYYIYVRSANLIFYNGDAYQTQDFFNAHVRSGQYDTWKRKLENEYFDFCNADVGLLNSLSENGVVEYRQSYPLGGVSRGTIVFVFDKGVFLSDNMIQKDSDKDKLFVLNKNDEIVFQTADTDGDLKKYLQMEEGYSYTGGRWYAKKTSDTGSLRYVWIDMGSQNFRSVRGISLFVSVYSIAVLLVGGLYIYSNTYRMSKHNRKIYELLGRKNDSDNILDWDVLVDNIEELSKQSHSLELLTSMKSDMVKNKLFINLLYEHLGYDDHIKAQLEEAGISFDAPDYMVVLYTFTPTAGEGFELVKYAMQNIFKDLMGSNAQWHFIDFSWNQAMLLFKGSFDEAFPSEARNVCMMTAEFLQSILNIELEFEISEICHSVEDIRSVSHKLLRNYEYKSMYNVSENTDDNGKASTMQYGYLQNQENELMSLTLSGAANEMKSFLERLIDEHRCTNPILRKTLYINLLGTLIKCSEKAGMNNFLVESDMDMILSTQNFDETEQHIKGFFMKMCESAAELKSDGQFSALSLKLKNYVDSNFQQPDLSLKTLSNEYNITVSYASKIFKEQLGRNFSDYLTEKRIKKAKQLLEETKLSISEIAQRTGYIDSSIFIKNFKKIMNTTPGAYRESFND